MKHLQIAWRMVFTAYGFVQFAVQVLWLGKIVMPGILRQSGAIAEKRRQALFQAHRHVSFYLKTLSLLGLVKFDFRGKPIREPAIIVANHPSLLDFIVLQVDFPNAICLYKSQTLRNPVLADFVQVAGYIEGMDGSRTASKRIIDECWQRLKEGHQVVFFPEGTRSNSNIDIRRFRFTGFHAAIHSNVAVQPVVIYSSPFFLGKNQPWHTFSQAKNRIIIEYLDPIRIEDLPQQKPTAKDLSNHVRYVIKKRLDKLDTEVRSMTD